MFKLKIPLICAKVVHTKNRVKFGYNQIRIRTEFGLCKISIMSFVQNTILQISDIIRYNICKCHKDSDPCRTCIKSDFALSRRMLSCKSFHWAAFSILNLYDCFEVFKSSWATFDCLNSFGAASSSLNLETNFFLLLSEYLRI